MQIYNVTKQYIVVVVVVSAFIGYPQQCDGPMDMTYIYMYRRLQGPPIGENSIWL